MQLSLLEICARQAIESNILEAHRNDPQVQLSCSNLLTRLEPSVQGLVPPPDEEHDPIDRICQVYRTIGHLTDISRIEVDWETTPLATIAEKIKDANLVRVFHRLRKQIPADQLPILTEDRDQNAKIIRSWMHENRLIPGSNPPARVLDQITRLNLTSIKLTGLPPEIYLLDHLETLDLSNNPLTHLPQGFHFPHLQELDLSRTRLTELPADLNTPKLRQLDLSYTRFSSFPPNFSPEHLGWIDLSYTRIAALPESFNSLNLHWLSFAHTQIAAIPESLNSQRLQFLNLSHTKVLVLPESFNAAMKQSTKQNLEENYRRLSFTERAMISAKHNMLQAADWLDNPPEPITTIVLMSLVAAVNRWSHN